MPLITDPRQIIQPLPASLIKEIPDGTRLKTNCRSAAKPSRARERKPNSLPTEPRAEARKQEAEIREKPDTSSGAIATVAGREIRDKLYPNKRLVECWTLSTSEEVHGEMRPMSAATKELCQQEAILWAARERDRDKWMAF